MYDDTLNLKEIFSTVTPEFDPPRIRWTSPGSHLHPLQLRPGRGPEERPIDSVIALYGETAVFDADNLSLMIGENSRNTRTRRNPWSFHFGREDRSCLLSMRKGGGRYGDVYQAVSCLASIYRYYYLKEYSQR
jgi:hypothetical protein